MKKLLSLSLLAVTTSALANTGTTHFIGSISDTTCNVVTSQNGLEGNTVDLGTYTTSSVSSAAVIDFALEGKKLDGTPCLVASGKKVDISWLPSSGSWTTGGLRNTGTAKGVSVSLMDKSSNAFSSLKQNVEYQDTDVTLGKMPFKAKLVADGTGITAGTVVSSAKFAVAYK